MGTLSSDRVATADDSDTATAAKGVTAIGKGRK
jgi:hypothetical protein